MSSLKSLGPAIIQAMQEDYPKMSGQDQTAIREFFMRPQEDAWQRVNAVLPALQEWLNTRPNLKEDVLLQPGHLLATCTMPLLVWAKQQSWSRDLDAARAMNTWKNVSCAGVSLPARLLQASVGANMLASVLDQWPQEDRQSFQELAYTTCASVGNTDFAWGATPKLTVLHCSALFIGLGHLAEGSDMHALYWEDKWHKMWMHVGPTEQTLCATSLLESDLPPTFKLKALSYATSDLWRTGPIHFHLQSVLPTEEFERAQMLPFMRTLSMPGLKLSSSALIQRLTMIESNKELLRAYCPQMYTHFDMLARDEDWLSPETLKAWALRFKPEHPAETLILPEEYNI